MPAKLTETQIEALRNVDRYGEFRNVHAATKRSLESRGLVTFVEPALTWALTAEGETVLRQYDGCTETDLAIENCLQSPNAEMVAPGVRIWNEIVEPDHSDDDTQPLEPLKTTFHLYDNPEPKLLPKPEITVKELTVRDQYRIAYCAERIGASETPRTDVDDPNLWNIPADIYIAAHQSHTARPGIFEEYLPPFIVRTWYKRLLDAQKRLSTIPLDDNAGFNDAVLDFKLTKSRYMSIAQHWNSVAEQARYEFARLKLLWKSSQSGVQVNHVQQAL